MPFETKLELEHAGRGAPMHGEPAPAQGPVVGPLGMFVGGMESALHALRPPVKVLQAKPDEQALFAQHCWSCFPHGRLSSTTGARGDTHVAMTVRPEPVFRNVSMTHFEAV